jgi:hypothetical protein
MNADTVPVNMAKIVAFINRIKVTTRFPAKVLGAPGKG